MKTIPMSKGNHAIVDDEDYEWLSKYKWYDSGGYAVTNTYTETGEFKSNWRMHRMIMNPPDDKVIDHINGNKSDNRKENLRIVTIRQNTWNTGKRNDKNVTSNYKGVSYERGRHRVKIGYNDKKENIGTFLDEVSAANAYNYYARLHFGEFAKLNDVPYMEKEEWESNKLKSSSTYRGVTWVKDVCRWKVVLYDKKLRKQECVGEFVDEVVAANYYNHLMKNEINKCEYVSLEECESKKYKRSKSSSFTGVSWNKKKNIWEVNVWDGSKKYFVGYFDSEIDAALSYNKKAIELNVKNLDRKLNQLDEEHEKSL
jgi:hypothetical protein